MVPQVAVKTPQESLRAKTQEPLNRVTTGSGKRLFSIEEAGTKLRITVLTSSCEDAGGQGCYFEWEGGGIRADQVKVYMLSVSGLAPISGPQPALRAEMPT